MKYIYIIISIAAIAQSCNHAPATVETETPYSLTDAMMSNTRFAAATMQNVTNELRLYGKVTADNDKIADVYSVISGNVIKVNVELGDYVHQGQILAVTRSSEVAGYEKDKADAMNDVANAEKNLKVARDLYEGKLNTDKDVAAAETDLKKAQSSLVRINEVYNIYNLKPGGIYNVTAPISGFIIEKNITSNVLLIQSNVNNLFTIAQISDVWVLANVNESDIGLINQGMKASIKTMSYPDRIFTGTVDRIFNILDPATKAMKVRIRLSNTDLALKPEMSATVTLSYTESKRLIAIPSSSIVFDKSKNWVMVFKDRSHIETREVEIYRKVGDTTYIAGGLKEGETVITQNQMLIYDALND